MYMHLSYKCLMNMLSPMFSLYALPGIVQEPKQEELDDSDGSTLRLELCKIPSRRRTGASLEYDLDNLIDEAAASGCEDGVESEVSVYEVDVPGDSLSDAEEVEAKPTAKGKSKAKAMAKAMPTAEGKSKANANYVYDKRKGNRPRPESEEEEDDDDDKRKSKARAQETRGRMPKHQHRKPPAKAEAAKVSK